MRSADFSGFFHIACSLVIGGLLFYMLDPLVCIMEKRQGVKREAVPGIVFAMLITVIVGAAVLLAPIIKEETVSFAKRLPEAVSAIDGTVDLILDKVFGSDGNGGLRKHIEAAITDVKTGVELQIKGFLDNAAAIFKNVAAVILDVITGVIFAYYFIKDKERIGGKLMGLVPFSVRSDVVKLSREISVIISSFIRGQFTVALIVGLIETAGMWAIGLPVPWLFGVIGGISNLIPYVGPVIGAVPAVFGALLVSPWRAILTVILFVAVQQLDNNFISPKIIEGKLGVHPVVSIIVLFIAGELCGIAGILLGIPLYAVIRCFFKYFVERRVRAAEAKRR